MSRPDTDAILRRVASTKLMYKLAVDEIDLPAHLAGGAGIGAAGGLISGAMKSLPAVKEMTQIQGQLPNLQAQRAKLTDFLTNLRQQSPVPLTNVTDRRLTNLLLKSPSSPEQYYMLRQGAEGISGTSRATKVLQLLQKRLKTNLLKRSLLGAGAGLGAGLLTATARGRFDTPE